jgi:pimeloyl-ACP methyl ester carboxylesterase
MTINSFLVNKKKKKRMNTWMIYDSVPNPRVCIKRIALCIFPAGIFLVLASLFSGCEKETFDYGPEQIRQYGSETALVREFSFTSGDFTVVGDLRSPEVGEKHPLVLMIHGSGDATREGAVPFSPMIEIFLRHGYAVLSWDKPGSGESKGTFENGYTSTQRARIIKDAIEALSANSSLNLSEIGLWGLSQAGWVMPMALDKTPDISWMMVVSGGGEDGIEQGAYQVAQRIGCEGGSEDDIATVEAHWAMMNKALTYNAYKNAVQILLDVPGLYENTGLIMSEEEQWSPWPREIDAFFDPVDVLQRTTIPVLAFFGELDKYIDPVQGFQAYKSALEKAGNTDYQVHLIEGAGHVMVEVETGCPGEFVGTEYMTEYLEALEFWLMER